MAGFRTLIISSRCKLSLELNYLVKTSGLDTNRVNIDEIKFIYINSLEVSITSSLIAYLIEKKIKIVFCDYQHMPSSEIVGYSNNHYSPEKIARQININSDSSDFLWREIIKEKIHRQALLLKYFDDNENYSKLEQLTTEIEYGDSTNKEGTASRIYFIALFGRTFTRSLDIDINRFLNYGYHILLSIYSRSIKSLGFLTEIGIHHKGRTNQFNLACDFLEPLRPMIDFYVSNSYINNDNYKEFFKKIFEKKVKYCDKEYLLDNAVDLQVADFFNFLFTGDITKINFIEYDL